MLIVIMLTFVNPRVLRGSWFLRTTKDTKEHEGKTFYLGVTVKYFPKISFNFFLVAAGIIL